MSNRDKIWLYSMKIFSKSCHQKSDRSFFFYNYQFPICARCTGLLIGYIVGIISLFFNYRISIVLSLLFMIIMFLDWFTQYINFYSSTNTRRFLTGFICAFGIISILANVTTKIFSLF
ncbi:DUF2085 domain-containing protein [Clostridium tertium]|uniref:DUF2085 domain-containing protein n=2 Tax=Clostridium tertium TaxID=1559 RepID=A0A6N2YPX5_9CLOT